MDEFSQGTIIQFIISPNHPNVQSSGIVINARCDIAQRKIARISLLTCMTLDEWIYNVFFEELIIKIKQKKYDELNEFCNKNNLKLEILEEFGPEKALIAIEKCDAKGKEKDKAIKLLDDVKKYEQYISTNLSAKEKKDLIAQNKDKLKSKLSELHNGQLSKYCFIPQKGYIKDSKVLADGIVIDLHDIVQISYEQFENACKGKIDCKKMTSEEIKKASDVFSFKEYDFVFAQKDFCIKSPWIEHLMQKFALAYSRIGIENAEKNEIYTYYEKWIKGEMK